jgi:hypothetical protein
MSGVRRAERKEHETMDAKEREREAFEMIVTATSAQETRILMSMYVVLTGNDMDAVFDDVLEARQARHERAMAEAYGEGN